MDWAQRTDRLSSRKFGDSVNFAAGALALLKYLGAKLGSVSEFSFAYACEVEVSGGIEPGGHEGPGAA